MDPGFAALAALLITRQSTRTGQPATGTGQPATGTGLLGTGTGLLGTGTGLRVRTFSVPNGAVGTPYPATTLSASGGTGTLQWSVTGGVLPDGLTLSQAGVISGTPDIAGLTGFTVTVTDSSTPQQQASAQLAISVLGVTTDALPDAPLDAPYPPFVLSSDGGAGALTWRLSSGTLPAGLTLSPAGVISGTATAAGQASFTVTVTDSARPPATASAELTIDVAQLTIGTATLPPGAVGSNYSASLAATGGTGTLQWSVTGGALPDGLTLSPAGAIYGTPAPDAAGTAAFTVTVTDSGQVALTASAPLTLSVLGITSSGALREATVGNSYLEPLASAGGAGTLSWNLTGGALPGGLNLSTNGVISGTPDAPGQASFTVTVTDGGQPPLTASAQLTLSVLGITTAALPEGAVGLAYTKQLAATGGTAPLAWRVSDGAPPDGIILSTDGILSGTPTTAGTASFTVAATDSASPPVTATAALTLAVAGEPVEIPRVHGKLEVARAKLAELGLTVSDAPQRVISESPAGTVVGSVPPAGTLVAPASVVTIAVSNAVEVPSVLRLSAEAAVAVLAYANLVGVVAGSASTQDTAGLVVVAQDPLARYWVQEQSTVVLTLGTVASSGDAPAQESAAPAQEPADAAPSSESAAPAQQRRRRTAQPRRQTR